MEDRVYNRRDVLQRELWNSEAVMKKLKEESEMEEKLFRVHCSRRFLFFFLYSAELSCRKQQSPQFEPMHTK